MGGSELEMVKEALRRVCESVQRLTDRLAGQSERMSTQREEPTSPQAPAAESAAAASPTRVCLFPQQAACERFRRKFHREILDLLKEHADSPNLLAIAEISAAAHALIEALRRHGAKTLSPEAIASWNRGEHR